MRRPNQRTMLALVLLSVAGLGAMAKNQTKSELPPVSDNAALQYWQAFAMLPALSMPRRKSCWRIGRRRTPLNDASRKLLDQSHASLMFRAPPSSRSVIGESITATASACFCPTWQNPACLPESLPSTRGKRSKPIKAIVLVRTRSACWRWRVRLAAITQWSACW